MYAIQWISAPIEDLSPFGKWNQGMSTEHLMTIDWYGNNAMNTITSRDSAIPLFQRPSNDTQPMPMLPGNWR
jgi:hypothetical protein